ncbi:hypothetical protein Tco_1556134 [Tanacetum coccineum]
MHMTILKKNYENFAASSQEGLDKTYDRFQKLIGQLENPWVKLSLRRCKSEVVKKSYESEIKGQTSSSSNSQNVAFVSSDNFSSTNETVNDTISVSALDKEDIRRDDAMILRNGSKWQVCNAYHRSLRGHHGIWGIANRDVPKKECTRWLLYYTMPLVVSSMDSPKSDQTKPKFTKINFVKSDENVKSVNKENTHRQVEYPRKSQSPRDNRRNWNGMMTQKLGNGFESIKKACFVCGSLNHLIKDCDFHENKMVEKPVLNNKGRVTGQREIRPVWNNAQRVNHQNKLTHPHPKRNFVPTTVATKSGQVPVNAAKQSSPRAAASISTARPVNTAAPKPKTTEGNGENADMSSNHARFRDNRNTKSVNGLGPQEETNPLILELLLAEPLNDVYQTPAHSKKVFNTHEKTGKDLFQEELLQFVCINVGNHQYKGGSTAGESVCTAGVLMPVSTAGMVQEINKDKGKGIMTESKPEQTKTKLQQRQEIAGYEAAIRLQEWLDEEERQRISRVHEEASSFNIKEWENIQATIEADEELA